MRRTIRIALFSVLGALAVIGLRDSQIVARAEGEPAYVLPDDPILATALRAIRKAIADGNDWDYVADALQALLTKPGNSAITAPDQRDWLRASIAHVKAEDLLASLPEKGRQAYRAKFGPRASAMLKEATDKNDIKLLHGVRREFFYTDAGREATLLSGKHYFEREDYHLAALVLVSLRRRPDPPLDASYLYTLARALSRSNGPDAPDVWKELIGLAEKDGKVVIDGTPMTAAQLKKQRDNEKPEPDGVAFPSFNKP